MSGYDEDVFGSSSQGFDASIFSTEPAKKKLEPVIDPVKPKPLTFREMGAEQMAVTGPAMSNLSFGGQLGAGSLGATLLAPYDIAKDALSGKGLSLESNNQRRADMEGALSSMGADVNSRAFQGGKLGMEVAGTMGTGGLLAKGLGAVPWMSRAGPLIDAIGSSGMRAGGMTGLGGLGVRTAGSAITGGLSAGLVNPEDAGSGALIGAVTPSVVMGAGKLGSMVGDRIAAKQAAQAAELSRKQPFNDTLKAGMDAGFIVPPTLVNPSFSNTVKGSIAGKAASLQQASTQNQSVTDGLVRKSLGMADDAPLSVEAIKKLRGDLHATGYEPLRQVGMVPADKTFASDLGKVAQKYTGKGTIPAVEKTEISDLVKAHKSTGFDAGDAVDAIRILREDASDAFQVGNSALGGAKKAIADAYEGALDRALPPGSDLLKNYRAARQNIAKSFTVEDALREGTGSVDARKLAAALQNGDPLSGDLLTAARFASAFPRATQPPNLVQGPGVNNLKSMFAGGAGAAGGALGAVVGGPAGAAIGSGIGAGATFVVPELARLQMFSKGAQQALLPKAVGGPGAIQGIAGLLADQTMQQRLLQTSPIAMRGLLSAD